MISPLSNAFAELVVEDAALAVLEAFGVEVRHGPAIAEAEPDVKRADPNHRDVVLEARLRKAPARLNPALPAEALEDAFRRLTRLDVPTLLERNRAAHRRSVNSVTVEYRRANGSIVGGRARVLDFDEPANNDCLSVNQFTVSAGQHRDWRGVAPPVSDGVQVRRPG